MAEQKLVAELLKAIIQSSVIDQYGIELSEETDVVQKQMMDYEGRMRTLGLDKFNGLCYLAAVSLYKSEASQEKQDAVGGLIVYVEDEVAERVFKALGQKANMDDESILNAAGAIAKNMAEGLNKQLSAKGFSSLVISEPVPARNDLSNGIPFHKSQYTYYEYDLHIWKQKAVVVALTLATKAL